MTCGSLMTRNPSCCLPGDSVSTAARIMKKQDVGPVLVVSDHNRMQLVGIVTDRDIAINVVAEGRDPYSCRVDSIMSSDPVTVREDDDVMEAVRQMADNQVRRVPVVDENNCVVGIISQADVAMSAEEEAVGEMVEEISQPSGMGHWMGRRSGMRSRDPISALAMGAVFAGLGAGLMFLFDPNRGQVRRSQLMDKGNELRDRGAELWNQRGELLRRGREAGSQQAIGDQQQEPWQGESQIAGQRTPGSIQH